MQLLSHAQTRHRVNEMSEFDAPKVHIMVDLETASTEPNAAIVQLAAVVVVPPSGGGVYPRMSFNEYASLASNETYGLDVSKETLEWWSGQEAQLRARVFGGQKSIWDVLYTFHHWCAQRVGGEQYMKDRLFLWGNGADFDCTILKSAYEKSDTYPFNFRNHRCYRTIRNVCGSEDYYSDIVNETKHDALSDATYQARVLERIIQVRHL